MSTAGLFLSAFFPYFPVSTLLLLGALTFALTLPKLSPSPRLLGFFLAGSFLVGLLALSPAGPLQSGRNPRLVQVCLDAIPEPTKTGIWVSGQEASSPSSASGRLRIFIPAGRLPLDPLVRGDCMEGEMTPFPLSPEGFPIDHGRNAYRISDSSPLTFYPDTSPISHFFRRITALAENLSRSLRVDYPPDTAGLLAALVLSDTRFLPPDSLSDFRQAGISHLLSVSGEHMTLLAFFLGGVFLLILRLLPFPLLRSLSVRMPLSRLLILPILPLLGLYTLMIGLPPAADRAFLGFSLVSLLKVFFVDLTFPEVLGLSTLIMLLFAPSLARSLSFLLSLLALWALVLGQAIPAKNAKKGKEGLSLRQTLRSGILITLFTTPLLALVFRSANPAGILANPILVPLAGDMLLPLGFFDLFLRIFLSHTPVILTLLTGALSHSVLGLAAGFADLPGSTWTIPGANPLPVLLFYLAVFLLILSPSPALRHFAPPLLLLLIFSIALPAPPGEIPYASALSTGTTGSPQYWPGRERENLGRLLQAPREGKMQPEDVQ